MRLDTKITEVYEFKELKPDVQEKVLNNFRHWNVEYDWWDFIYDDAKNIGIKINGFDLDRGSYVKMEYIWSIDETVNAILKDHWVNCSTYQTALKYREELDKINPLYDADDNTFDDLYEELKTDFLHDLSEDYRIRLQKEYEYRTSDEGLKEIFNDNDMEFTKEGILY